MTRGRRTNSPPVNQAPREGDLRSLPTDFSGHKSIARYRSPVLHMSKDSTIATIRPSWITYACCAFSIVMGIALFYVGYGEWVDPQGKIDAMWRFGVYSVWTTGIACLLAGLFGYLPWWVKFDKQRDMLTIRRRLAMPVQYTLSNIIALQICHKLFNAQTGPSSTNLVDSYELNAVFAPDHEPRRVRVMAHCHEKWFVSDAQKLAEYLGVPLLKPRSVADPEQPRGQVVIIDI